ncbi:MAG: type II toxin-antitoxin system RelB/DinJ family antitoxin [Anaerotardibacter sp.]
MATSNVTIRMDENFKRQADEVLNEMGMNFTTAVNIFTRQVIRERKIPFEVTTGSAKNTIDTKAVKAAVDFAEEYSIVFERMAQ